jgi:hypothetical protein
VTAGGRRASIHRSLTIASRSSGKAPWVLHISGLMAGARRAAQAARYTAYASRELRTGGTMHRRSRARELSMSTALTLLWTGAASATTFTFSRHDIDTAYGGNGLPNAASGRHQNAIPIGRVPAAAELSAVGGER